MVNHLIIQGRTTADLEKRQTTSGVDVVSFTLAWNEKYKDVDTVCFQRCKAWRGVATFLDKFFHDKGSMMIVEGHLETEKWTDKNGIERSENVLTVDKAHFAGTAGKKSDAPAVSNAGATGGTFTPASDDELPF